MKDNTLSIRIKRPASDIFEFALDPTNTPAWVDSFEEEKRSESPTKLGTVYESKGKDGKWSKHTITTFEKDRLVEFTSEGGTYHAKYTFTPLKGGGTEITYYEWVDVGLLEDPFPQSALIKLKELLEQEGRSV